MRIISKPVTVNSVQFSKCANKGTFTFRSSLEYKFVQLLEQASNVIQWSYETVNINYFFPYDKKVHTYIIDFAVQTKTGMILVEIKPSSKLILERQKSRDAKIDFAKNIAKWKAAQIFCNKHNYEFKIITEKDIK